MLINEWLAKWLGIVQNNEKRKLPQAKTRHLWFVVDLKNKGLSITEKHKLKVLAFFNNFLMVVRKQGGIPIWSIQELLGLHG